MYGYGSLPLPFSSTGVQFPIPDHRSLDKKNEKAQTCQENYVHLVKDIHL